MVPRWCRLCRWERLPLWDTGEGYVACLRVFPGASHRLLCWGTIFLCITGICFGLRPIVTFVQFEDIVLLPWGVAAWQSGCGFPRVQAARRSSSTRFPVGWNKIMGRNKDFVCWSFLFNIYQHLLHLLRGSGWSTITLHILVQSSSSESIFWVSIVCSSWENW